MIKFADYKAPGKKLIRLKVDIDKNTIKSCQINGDFFIFPIEGQEILEKTLENKPLNIEIIGNTLEKALKDNNIEILGIEIKDILEAFKKVF